MTTKASTTSVREAVGIFINAQPLQSTIRDLQAAGFTAEQLGLLASEDVVARSLGELYTRINNKSDSPQSPAIAFIGKDTTEGSVGVLGGSLYFVGASGVMGAVVASAAVFGGALLAAVGGIVGVGLVGALVASVIHQSDAEYLQQQVDEGHMLLFVRIVDSATEKQALDILTRHCAVEVKMYDVPVNGKIPTAPYLQEHPTVS